jgi:hypothetical protein
VLAGFVDLLDLDDPALRTIDGDDQLLHLFFSARFETGNSFPFGLSVCIGHRRYLLS